MKSRILIHDVMAASQNGQQVSLPEGTLLSLPRGMDPTPRGNIRFDAGGKHYKMHAVEFLETTRETD